MREAISLKKEIIHEYRGTDRGCAASKTNPAWRGTTLASAPPTLLQEKAGLGLHYGRRPTGSRSKV